MDTLSHFPIASESDECNEIALALDLGGTRIKGVVCPLLQRGSPVSADDVLVWENSLNTTITASDFAELFVRYCRELARGRKVLSIVASTAGEVSADGKSYLIAATHLGAMGSEAWIALAEAELDCPITLINDAEAFMLGAAMSGKLAPDKAVGGIVFGTGVGFVAVRDGRWWKPNRRLQHLGSVQTGQGSYDSCASAVRAATMAKGDLCNFLSSDRYLTERSDYLEGVSKVVATATILFNLDEIILGGGLIDASIATNFDIAGYLINFLPELLPPKWPLPKLIVLSSGNLLTLDGVCGFAIGNARVADFRFQGNFQSLSTERSALSVPLENLSSGDVARHLIDAECKASSGLLIEADKLGEVAMKMATAIRNDGRVIYVGAGTSGRIGALDAVEIPCTFGLPSDRFVAVIAGGSSDACLTIESNSEEDISAVPDMLLLQLTPRDIVIGISASGTAFFVRSALAYAKTLGSFTVLLHENDVERSDFFDVSIRLYSGPELVRGSTRMKAGTSTKRALNVLSTTSMILLGKVQKGFMVDLDSSNEKLRCRAETILSELADLPREDARAILQRHNYVLRRALSEL